MKVKFKGVLVAPRHLPDWDGLTGAIHAAIFSHQGVPEYMVPDAKTLPHFSLFKILISFSFNV
jgi:hypothetical protein